MTILKLAGRTLGMIIGVIGAFVALLVTIFTVVAGHLEKAINPGTGGSTHGFIGFLSFLVGLIGALIAIPFPSAAALLMVVAGLAMIYVAGAWAILGAPLLIIGAILAFLDRSRSSSAS